MRKIKLLGKRFLIKLTWLVWLLIGNSIGIAVTIFNVLFVFGISSYISKINPQWSLSITERLLSLIFFELLFLVLAHYLAPLFFLHLQPQIRKKFLEFRKTIYSLALENIHLEIDRRTHGFELSHIDRQKTKIRNVIDKALYDLKHEISRGSVDCVIKEIQALQVSKIIATSASPMYLWFHHEIITYFTAQIVKALGNTTVKRFYILDHSLLEPIRQRWTVIYDEFEAACKIHTIGGKELYLVWLGNMDNRIPAFRNQPDKSFLALFGDNDVRVMSFQTEGTRHEFIDIEPGLYNSYTTFLNDLEDLNEHDTLDDFLMDVEKNTSCKIKVAPK